MEFNTTTEAEMPLLRFRTRVMADPALADALCQTDDASRFAELAVAGAAAHGIALTADTILEQIRPDPLGLSRWAVPLEHESNWPHENWLPISLAVSGDRIFVDWAYFGPEPLTEPFFEGSIRRAMRRPFNRLFRYRMTLDDFLRDAEGAQSLLPSGFIFHMSRCGSTLVSQMLAALPVNVAISEAAPIDAVVQLSHGGVAFPAEVQCKLLVAMMAALGRRRSGHERHCFVKLDCWHMLALPLFRRAFPNVPWVFLYREPVGVLVSQLRERGMQMVPEFVSPGLFGLDGAPFGQNSIDGYGARVLAKICQAAADDLDGGLLVNYRELPDAIWSRILPHFGVSYVPREREIMNRAARYDAKAPAFEFAGDSAAKQHQASDLIRTLADRHLGAVYRRLEDLRGSQSQ